MTNKSAVVHSKNFQKYRGKEIIFTHVAFCALKLKPKARQFEYLTSVMEPREVSSHLYIFSSKPKLCSPDGVKFI